MTFKTLTKVGVAALAVALAGCASQPKAPEHSGFLGDYSQLQQTTDSTGATIARAVNPSFRAQNYYAILIDPVIFYPEPQPTDKVSMADLDAIRAYINQALYTQLGKTVRVVDKAGPGVLRLRVAITSVSTQETSLKAYQYIPIAFIVTKAADAAKGTPEEGKLFVESELSDSVTGVRMMSAVRSGVGDALRPSTDASGKLVVESLKPMLDKWGQAVAAEAPKFVQGVPPR